MSVKCYTHVYYRFGGNAEATGEPVSKEEANFGLSGKLTAETNMYKVMSCSFCKINVFNQYHYVPVA